MLKYLENLKSQGKIKEYRENLHCIAIDLNCGGTFIYSFDLPDGLQSSTTISTPENNKQQSLDTISQRSILTAQPNNNSLSSTVFDDMAILIENANIGYQFTNNSDDSSVTVETLKTFPQYKIIIWDGHGGYDSVRHSYFQIGETWGSNPLEKYPDDISNGRLVPLQDHTYAVTTAFFEFYFEDNSFNDTLIYLGCCDGAMDNVLSNTLIKKGAEAVLGYNNAVYSGYNRNMCETIFNELVKKDGETSSTKTIAEALETAKKKNGEKDPTSKRAWFEASYKNNDYRAELILTENDDISFRLVDEKKIDNDQNNANTTLNDDDDDTTTTTTTTTAPSTAPNTTVPTTKAPNKETTTKPPVKNDENPVRQELLNYYWIDGVGSGQLPYPDKDILEFTADNKVYYYEGDISKPKSTWIKRDIEAHYTLKGTTLNFYYNDGNNTWNHSVEYVKASDYNFDVEGYIFYETDFTPTSPIDDPNFYFRGKAK